MQFKCKYNICNAKCCRNLRGNAGTHYYDLDEIRYVHLIVNPDNASISITNDEKIRLEKKALELGLVVKLSPLKIVVTKDMTPLVLKWHIDHDNCPFLSSDNKCKIYSDRPLICKSFPLLPRRLSFTRKFNLLEMSTFCPETKGLEIHNLKTNPDNTDLEYHNIFDEAYHAYTLVHELNDELESRINDSIKSGHIKNIKTRTAVRLLDSFNGKLDAF